MAIKNLCKVYFLALVVIISLCSCEKMKTQDLNKNIEEAKTELGKKNLSKTIELAIQIKKTYPNNPEASYLEAQAYSMSGDLDEALNQLEDALENGFKNFEDLKKNKNLDSLRKLPLFEVVVKKYSPEFSSDEGESLGDVSIKNENGKQIIRAGDVTISLPSD